jgi:hypothetical protein
MKANYDKHQLFVEQVWQLHKHTPIVVAATVLKKLTQYLPNRENISQN